MAFFEPFVADDTPRPVICYTDTDMAKIVPGINRQVVEEMLGKFLGYWGPNARRQFLEADIDFMLAFIWTNSKEVFIDLWQQRQLETYGPAAPMTTLVTHATFGEEVIVHLDPWDFGNACNWTRIVSGREAELFHQKYNVEKLPLSDYINGPRPDIPFGLIEAWPGE